MPPAENTLQALLHNPREKRSQQHHHTSHADDQKRRNNQKQYITTESYTELLKTIKNKKKQPN